MNLLLLFIAAVDQSAGMRLLMCARGAAGCCGWRGVGLGWFWATGCPHAVQQQTSMHAADLRPCNPRLRLQHTHTYLWRCTLLGMLLLLLLRVRGWQCRGTCALAGRSRSCCCVSSSTLLAKRRGRLLHLRAHGSQGAPIVLGGDRDRLRGTRRTKAVGRLAITAATCDVPPRSVAAVVAADAHVTV